MIDDVLKPLIGESLISAENPQAILKSFRAAALEEKRAESAQNVRTTLPAILPASR